MRNPTAAGSRGAGFTLVELMIVVSIIGLLAVLAIPGFRKARMHAEDSAFINVLRVLNETAIQQCAIVTGNYPEDVPPGVVPAGLAGYLPRGIDWSRPTPIGGLWDWDRAPTRGSQVHGCYAGLSVAGPLRTSAQMRDIDARIDDGNLDTGTFRMRAGGYIRVLE